MFICTITLIIFSDEEKLYYIISEVYDGDSDGFELQLDNALDENYKIIIIEPNKLGDETTRWIACGNWIHKVAVTSGLGSIFVGEFLKSIQRTISFNKTMSFHASLNEIEYRLFQLTSKIISVIKTIQSCFSFKIFVLLCFT